MENNLGCYRICICLTLSYNGYCDGIFYKTNIMKNLDKLIMIVILLSVITNAVVIGYYMRTSSIEHKKISMNVDRIADQLEIDLYE